MRSFNEPRVLMMNRLIRQRAARQSARLMGTLLAEQSALANYVTNKLAEIEAQVLAGDQRVRDDLGAAVVSVVEAHNESCESLVKQSNSMERAIQLLADRVLGEKPRSGSIPDSLNKRRQF